MTLGEMTDTESRTFWKQSGRHPEIRILDHFRLRLDALVEVCRVLAHLVVSPLLLLDLEFAVG